MPRRHRAEIIVSLAEVCWFIEGAKYSHTGPYKDIERSPGNLEAAWREYDRLKAELRKKANQ